MGVSCPACGRPVAVRRASTCIYCGAHLGDAGASVTEDPLAPRVRACFTLLARCRTDGDLAPALPFLAPDLAQRFEQEIEENRRSEVRHVIDRVTLGAIDVPPEQDGGRRVIIEATYAEYWQDVRSHMVLRGLRNAKPHRHAWHLLPANDGVQAPARDRCPGCGADLGVGIDVRCPYCNLVPRINRLGFTLCAIDTVQPDWAEWKRLELADQETGWANRPSDFWDALRELLQNK